jgi:hypothetical protein
MADFDIAQFRADFQEFASEVTYPDPMITFWSGLGDTMLNVLRWGNFRPYGMSLFVAHNITLAARNLEPGVSPGSQVGIVTNESVGPLSVGMDVSSATEKEGGNYNLTTYGNQFIRLARIVGMGGVEL